MKSKLYRQVRVHLVSQRQSDCDDRKPGAEQGFEVDERAASMQLQANVDALKKLRDRLRQRLMLPVGDNFSESVIGYMLMAMAAGGYKSDLNTDAAVMEMASR